MKLARFHYQGRSYQAELVEQRLHVVHSLFERPLRHTGEVFALEAVSLLAPCQPGKIICAGINYRSHADDGHRLPETPLLFLKSPSAVAASGQAIPQPALSQQVDFEGELAVVIGQHAEAISETQLPDCILGYCCANDVTARDIQQREANYGTAKNFAAFAPLGPWIETDFDAEDFWLETRLNGALKQRAHSSDLLFSIPELVVYISQVMALEAGDVILCGTPRGMGPMRVGDQVEVSVSGLGSLCNRLQAASECDARHRELCYA